MDTRISVVKAPLGYSCVSLPAAMQVRFISCAVGVRREKQIFWEQVFCCWKAKFLRNWDNQEIHHYSWADGLLQWTTWCVFGNENIVSDCFF
jgi:hypothetical protein